MGFDHFLGNGQAESGSLLLATREEGFEEEFHPVHWDNGASLSIMIADRKGGPVLIVFSNLHRFEPDPALSLHGLNRIGEDIDKHPSDFERIHVDEMAMMKLIIKVNIRCRKTPKAFDDGMGDESLGSALFE